MTLSSAADSPILFPCASRTWSLYVPALAGTAMEVAVPDAAFVIVAPATKVVVPAGANQTVFAAAPLLRMAMLLVPRASPQLAGKTWSWVDTSAGGKMAA